MVILLAPYHAVVETNDFNSESGQQKSSDPENNDTIGGDQDNTGEVKGGQTLEPYVGMQFESEDDATKFYSDYAKRVGFVVRVMRNETDHGSSRAHCLVCNKHGLSSSPKGKTSPEGKAGSGGHEGCNAMIHFKLEKSGKWVVTKFVKQHNHPLDDTALRDKDKKIHELTGELQRQEELFAAYRERFINLVADIEKQADQHLSPKVLAVVQNVKKAEAEALIISRA